MGALDQVTKMRSQGKTDDEIINSLQEQGVAPKAINDALGQSNIKDAVSKPVGDEGMEPSIMGEGAVAPAAKPQTQTLQPKTQEMGAQNQEDYYSPRTQPQEQTPQQDYGSEEYPQEYLPPQEEYYPQEGYDDYYGGGSYDTDTMIEISEQVFAEKIRKLQKQIEEIETFKVIAETKINHSDERLRRIENSMDKLQMAILEKIGSYGQGLESIKKEMSMMQNSFSKTLPALTRQHPPAPTTPSTTKTPHTPLKRTTKKTPVKKGVKKKSISRTQKEKDDFFSF